jgi:gliding motility-associated-like protein
MSASNVITLFQPFSLDLPTAFTPKGDGLNDEFGAVAKGLKDYKLLIYNRFGDLVFTSTDVNKQWDGTVKNKEFQYFDSVEPYEQFFIDKESDTENNTYTYQVKVINDCAIDTESSKESNTVLLQKDVQFRKYQLRWNAFEG